MLSPNDLQTGIPMGQPNSTVLIFSPIRFRSSGEGSPFNQSRTGSPPASVRKKIAGARLPCFSSACTWASRIVADDLSFLPTRQLYHIRYIQTKRKWQVLHQSFFH